MDISSWIERHAGFTPDKVAIRFEGEIISYADLARRISLVAGRLKHELGIRPGDRIGYLGFNHPELIILLFACARLGAMVMPLAWRLEEAEHKTLLADCAPVALFIAPEFKDEGDRLCDSLGIAKVFIDEPADLLARCQAIPAIKGEGKYSDPVLLCYTSGATGRPKGVVLDQNALALNAVNSTHMHDMVGDDVALTSLPMFHVGGLNIQTLPILHAGGTLVLHPAFDVAATFRDIQEHDVTLTVLVPTQITALLADERWQNARLNSLKVITTGSTNVPRRLIRQVHAQGIPLIQVYGSTETCPIATYLTADLAMGNEGSVGKVAIHCEMRLVDEVGVDVAAGKSGEILIRGGNVMREYWNAPEKTENALVDGWFYTGDIGHLDDNGFLYIDDRKKDMIISGGENIYPAEIENILAECQQISEVAIVGQADEKWGEIVVAVVVPTRGTDFGEEDVLAFLDGRLARFKHPRRVIFLEKLPRNAMGKVVKDDLRAMAGKTDTHLAERSV
ncbi:MAG: long-chain fatty acid--CoA ligase [Rhodobacteraceae bacterium]|nr:long-chain fatty acid--CoA ligase [Paracoccaceae bacterium]